jgi:molybdopterin molybdotransferase
LDGTTFAGQDASRPLLPGKCRRILTGARVPADVATIVMEEHVRREGAIIEMDRCPDHGANIRRAGEDVAAGAVVIRRGTILDGRHVAMLASIGAHHISSVRRLRVAVMSTGDELVEPGREVGAGMIPDANRPMILSLIAGPAIDATDLGMAADDGGDLAGRLADAGRRFDLLVTTGGVSGSEADLVSPALVAAGGRSEPMRLALRPGKPILSGRVGGCKIVALPGNPVAALVGYILFVRAVLIEMSGARSGAGSSPARAADPFPHKLGRTEFIPAAVVGRDCDGLPLLRKLGRGGSARLLPLVEADGFAEIPATAGDVAAGEFVSFHPFSTALNL